MGSVSPISTESLTEFHTEVIRGNHPSSCTDFPVEVHTGPSTDFHNEFAILSLAFSKFIPVSFVLLWVLGV